MVFVDFNFNVILDVITTDPVWQAWSEEQPRPAPLSPGLHRPGVDRALTRLIHASINHRASRPPTTASQLRRRSKLTSLPP
jgi:hypothetical protein